MLKAAKRGRHTRVVLPFIVLAAGLGLVAMFFSGALGARAHAAVAAPAQRPGVSAAAAAGLAAGSRIPAFQALDQNGKTQTFDSIRGPKGAVLYFDRSVQGCPACEEQVIEFQKDADAFRQQGWGLAVITRDPVAVLAGFAKHKNITVSMLSDSGSRMVRDFGILNTSIAPDDKMYGAAYPGTYIVDQDGMVQARYFDGTAEERYAPSAILLREFGVLPATRQAEAASKYLSVQYYASQDTVHPSLRITLAADVNMPPKMHVYAPTVKDYIPIRLEIASSPDFAAPPAAYPQPELLLLPAINEVVPVYQNRFRITQDISLAGSDALRPMMAGDATLRIQGTLHYQACDDTTCYLPQTVPLDWVLKVAPPEADLPPASRQHQAASPSGP